MFIPSVGELPPGVGGRSASWCLGTVLAAFAAVPRSSLSVGVLSARTVAALSSASVGVRWSKTREPSPTTWFNSGWAGAAFAFGLLFGDATFASAFALAVPLLFLVPTPVAEGVVRWFHVLLHVVVDVVQVVESQMTRSVSHRSTSI